MVVMRFRLPYLALSTVLLSVALDAQDPGRTDAARMEKKLTAIVARGGGAGTAPKRPAPLRTPLIDREVNAYFRINGPEFLPDGLVNPEITIDEGGRIRAKAIVDLDAALKPKQRSVFDPLAWLGGKTEVTAAGVVKAADGKGLLQLETATLAGISIPKSVLQQLVSYYTKTPEEPEGFNLDKPFALPANIRSVEMSRGQAIVVQP